MNVDEKLEHFSEVIINKAHSDSSKTLLEFRQSMDEHFIEHKALSLENAENEHRIAVDAIKKRVSRELATATLHIKREVSIKQSELKDKLFNEVKELLLDFRKTIDYKEMLVKQITHAITVSRDEKIVIYIDPADSDFKDYLEDTTNVTLTLSEYSFMGGTRAVIPSKNILIDNSFESKFEEYKDSYILTI